MNLHTDHDMLSISVRLCENSLFSVCFSRWPGSDKMPAWLSMPGSFETSNRGVLLNQDSCFALDTEKRLFSLNGR